MRVVWVNLMDKMDSWTSVGPGGPRKCGQEWEAVSRDTGRRRPTVGQEEEERRWRRNQEIGRREEHKGRRVG